MAALLLVQFDTSCAHIWCIVRALEDYYHKESGVPSKISNHTTKAVTGKLIKQLKLQVDDR